MSLTIGVDVGGTKVAAGVVDERGSIVEKLRRATPSSSPARTEQVIAGAVTELLSRHRVQAVGLGAAGFIDEQRASVRFAPNLAWREEPLRLRGEDLIGLPVGVENDANASAWAEVRFGSARGHAHVGCFATVGGWLGQGLADLAAILDPGCFVIGGGVSDAGELLLGPARAAFEKALPGGSHRHLAQIKPAQLGADAGIVGAADLARGAVPAPAGRAGRAERAGRD